MIALLLRDALLFEQLAHVVVVQVDGGHHDVAGLLAFQLDDALAEVGLDHLDALRLQIGVHLAFLGEHRLRLHHLLHVVLLEDAVDDFVELVGVLRPVYDDAVLLGGGGKLLQVLVEVGDGVALDGRSLLAQLFPLVKAHGHVVALGAHGPERGVVPLGVCLVLQELFGCFAVLCTHSPAAKISTTCLNSIFSPCFLATPAMCIRHEQSGPVMYSAPV